MTRLLSSLAPLLSFAQPFAYAYLSVGALTRVIIWLVFRADSKISGAALISALGLGVINDSIELLFILGPLLLVLCLIPPRALTRKAGQVVLGAVSLLGVGGALFIAIAEVLFWEEFESRFNLIAVDYLIYPTEVLGNINESYPIVPILAALFIITVLVWRPLWRRATKALVGCIERAPLVAGWRYRAIGSYATVVVPVSLLFSANTLSLMSNRAANELAENGIATFVRAALSQEIDYHQFYKTLPSLEAFQTVRSYYKSLGEEYPSNNPHSLVRHHQGNPNGLGKLNVVILGQESLGAQFVGAYGDTRGLTPFLDGLAKESLMFKNAYATGTRTVRGLEAMSASFPPIPSESIVKRPGGENVTTWGAIMRGYGYHTSFLYGGYGAFDNMNTYFGGNGFALSDRLDIKNVRFGNIWGVSDEDLLAHAISYYDNLAAEGKPFFSLVMSTSNHKPFTFREGVPGVPASGGGRLAGIRYADFSISEFFRVAKTKPWFNNTVFIVMADHDSRVYGRAYIPVEHYRIPVLVYAPTHIRPAVSDKVFSSIDLAPTVLGLLGLEYDAPFYGVDVLHPNIPASRPVMFSHNHNIAWYENDKLTVLGLQKEVRSFNYVNGKTTDAPTDEAAATLLAAHLQTAYELFKAHQY